MKNKLSNIPKVFAMGIGGVILGAVSIFAFLVIGYLILWNITTNTKINTLEKEEQRIIRLINKKYPQYTIISMDIAHNDGFYGNEYPVDEFNDANAADIILINNDEQLSLNLRKGLFRWYVKNESIDYGPRVVNDEYYARIIYDYANKDEDINEYIKQYIVVPDNYGNYYQMPTASTKWRYSFLKCPVVYKTQDGYVYEFNQESLEWEKSDTSYGSFSAYDKVDKQIINDAIEKYISYKKSEGVNNGSF